MSPYLQGTTTIKEAMENIKRACALGGVSVQATPVATTQSVPYMQMTERPDSRNGPRKDDHIELTALKFKGMIDSLDKFIDRLTKSVERSVEKQSRKLDRGRRSSTKSRNNRDSRNSRDDRRSYKSDSDSSLEDDRHRSRSRDSSRSRSRSIKTCTYCHKPNHDLSHCYKLAKDLKKLYSGNLKINGSGDKDEKARWQMLIDIKNFIESEKDSTN